MQVDTAVLRAAAKRLRDEVADPLTDAVGNTTVGEAAHDPDKLFDTYTTGAPMRELSGSWLGEITELVNAARELSDSLDRAAADYDRSDEGAAARLRGPR